MAALGTNTKDVSDKDQSTTTTTTTANQEEFLKYPDAEEYGPGLTKVPLILIANYGLVLTYNFLAWKLGNCHPLAMIIYYHTALMIFYVWHWQAHQKFSWNMECHRLHMAHHHIKFPPQNFFGGEKAKKYNSTAAVVTGTAGFQHELLLYILGIFALCVSYFVVHVRFVTVIWGLCGFLLVGYIGNYLHNSFHIPDHPFEPYRWFQELRALHYIHHLGSAKHNYAIVNFSLDKLMGGYFATNPVKSSSNGKMPTLKRQVSDEHRLVLGNVPAGIDRGAVLHALTLNEENKPKAS